MTFPAYIATTLQGSVRDSYNENDVTSGHNLTFMTTSDRTNITAKTTVGQSVNIGYMVRWWAVFAFIVTTLLGNGLTLWAVASTAKLRVKTYALVTSLAATDVIFALIFINYLIHDFWTLTVCSWWLYKSAVRPIERLVMYASFLHITIIAFDRYVAIIHPLTYESRMTSHTYRKLIIGVWVSAAVISIPPYLSLFGVFPPEVKRSPTPCIVTLWPVSEAFLELTIYVVNSLTVVLVYVRVWLTALHHGKKQMDLQFQQLPSISAATAAAAAAEISAVGTSSSLVTETSRNYAISGTSSYGTSSASTSTTMAPPTGADTKRFSYHKMVSKHRATRTVLALLTLYIVIWFPYCVSRILVAFGWPQGLTAWVYSGAIGNSNTSLNFVVYVVMNRDFRAAFKRILHIGTNGVQPDSFVSKTK